MELVIPYCIYHIIFTNKIVVTKLRIAITPDFACMIVFVFTSDNSQSCAIFSLSS